MGKREIVEIEKLIPGGKGLARIEGKAVFVPFVLPGEKIEISVTTEKKNFCEAELMKVLEPSDLRVQPRCPLYGTCGGCNMQHMDYDTQLFWKKDFAANLLWRNGGIQWENIPAEPSAPFGYRNRVQVHYSKEARGFKERSGSNVINVKQCPVASNGVNLFLNETTEGDPGDRITVFGLDDWYSTEKRGDEISLDIIHKKIQFNSSLFFQSNLSMLPALGGFLREHVTKGKLLDLYCGVGLLSSLVEDLVDEVEAVELNRHVSPYVSRNLSVPHNFYPLSLEKWISQRGSKASPRTVIIDPPRTGLSKSVRTYLNRCNADKILYISCDPATMTRDLKDLLADKYVMEDFHLFDFYPQTSHMEAGALLIKQ